VLLLALAAGLVYEARYTGLTVDEPVHVLSAALYWQAADQLKPRDLAPAIKIVGGWVPRVLGLPVPRDHPAWKKQEAWWAAVVMMDRFKRQRSNRLFFLARLPMLVFPLLTAWLLWRWGRQLYGGLVALLLVLLFAVEPSALGHGALFKNDLAATCAYFWFWYRAWRFWKWPGLGNALWLGCALLAAVLSKLSMLVLVPALPLIIVARAARGTVLRRSQAAAAFLLATVLAYLGALAASQFEARRLTRADLEALEQARLPGALVATGQVFRLLPAPIPLWEGAVSLWRSNNAEGNRTYMLGRQRPRGDRLYFLLALAVKTPVALQILLLAGSLCLLLRQARRQLEPADLFWLLPPWLYLALSSLSTLQLGIRLVLPALPFGLLISGCALQQLREKRRLWLAVLLVAGTAVESFRIFFHGISFFNLWAGGPDNGLKYLADSNLDWGQDLPLLRNRFDELKIRKLRLSYFGTDNPWRYFTDRELELIAPPWNDELAAGKRVLEPRPGYYAISATLLAGHLFKPQYRCFYSRFLAMKPIAKAGYSIFIYRVGS